MLAGAYSSYVIIAKQQQRVSAFAEVQESGIPTIRLLSRDLRMTGRIAYDANMDPAIGAITTPITITDSGDACCDTLQITYDDGNDVRNRVTYFTQVRTNPARNALYMDVENWDVASSSWTTVTDGAIVTDYVEDFQAEGSDLNGSSNPQIEDVAFVIRSINTKAQSSVYERPDHIIGNYDFSFDDNFHRDEFTATINIKNLR